ncbi:MAG: hypothetical protein AVDCRST_MAG73-1456 [uncultured Thermomicrobiales bacterium]|uniref:Periplasmic membrane protein n=1 Tax=uncultured Thermomicrobiales bacterium TaxID=1645740 RepID=A0A6J4U089_9BACT|nr:MAG: hypothetical protein AVDCRST_MAG73-1456 [uncultured Thermomicrobiales bacterium]
MATKPKMAEYEEFEAGSRQAWRDWLAANHDTSPGVWLVSYKKASGKEGVSYVPAVEEALCWGWIDSRPNKLDAERYRQLFTPRRPNSQWSAVNKRRVAALIADGRMAPPGLAKIEAAKADGSWNAYDAVEALTVPDDLAAAFAADEAAEAGFAAFSASAKKQLLWHLQTAKRPETRAKRIAQIVDGARAGRNPLGWRRENA